MTQQFDLLFDPLFRLPFVTGALLSVLLPVLGLYLRLRQEWLAALGFAHLAAAGGVLASLTALPMVASAMTLAGLGVVSQAAFRRGGNDAYAAMILLGWSVMLLGASFSHHAKMLGQALVDGQLYFTGSEHFWAALALALVVIALMPRLSPRLLRARLFPGQDQANGHSVRRLGIGCNLLVAASVGLGATAVGVIPAFALIFVPAWVAFALAPGWRPAVILAPALALAAYLVAFVGAMLLDLPIGPVLTACLVLLVPLRLLGRR
ncbi:MAG: metal ABC transporter permease [Ectothiorhodospiraceae bacterium]|nr:metal ABC transporter permease [Ectothiorhodospiraceae bacterium]